MDDLGTLTADPVDYPDTAARVAKSVARGEADAGIVIDGAGIGSAIAANKIAGVRAAVCHDPTMARYARQHNGANVLSLGSTLIQPKDALDVINVWLSTPMNEPRYIRRLAKIRALERLNWHRMVPQTSPSAQGARHRSRGWARDKLKNAMG